MQKRICRYACSLLVASILLVSCQGGSSELSLRSGDVLAKPDRFSLGFDLSLDDRPSAAVIFEVPPGTPAGLRGIYLPFGISELSNIESVHSAWMSLSDESFIYYRITPQTTGLFSLKFKPGFNYVDDQKNFSSGGAPGILSYERRGLERRFIFRLDSLPNKSITEAFLTLEAMDSVILKLPEKSRGMEISGTAQTTSPMPFRIDRGIKYFDTASILRTKDKTLDILYELPPNNYQVVAAEFISKFAIVGFILPFFQFLLVRPQKDIKHRRRIMWVFIGVQAALGLTLMTLAFLSWSGEIVKVLLDALVAITGGVVTFRVSKYEEKEA